MTHDELVVRAVRWLRRQATKDTWYKPGCGVVVPELVSYAGEQPDAIGWIQGGYSYLVECKCSLSDFHADKRKPRHGENAEGAGAQCLYLCEPGIIKPDQVTDHWGLLYCHSDKITMEVTPKQNPRRSMSAEMTMMYSLLRRVEVRGELTQCLSPKWGGDGPISVELPRGQQLERAKL